MDITYHDYSHLPLNERYHASGRLTPEQAIEFDLWARLASYLAIDPATRTYMPADGGPPRKVTVAKMGEYEGVIRGLAIALVIHRQGYKDTRLDGPYNDADSLVNEMVNALRIFGRVTA